MSYFQTPNGKWRVQLRSKHFPKFDRIFDTEAQAVEVQKFEEARRSGLHEGVGATMTVAAAAENYLNSTLFSGKAEKTQYEEERNLVPVLNVLGQNTLLYLSQNPSIIAMYRDKRARERSLKNPNVKVGHAKIRVELAALSSVFAWAVDSKVLMANPVVGIKRGSSKKRERRFEEGEERNLLTLTQAGKLDDQIIARFLLLALEIGCRVGELADVPLHDVNISEATITFRETKNHSDRTPHLPPVALEMVKEQMVFSKNNEAGRLFWTMGEDGKEKRYNYASGVKRLRKNGVVKKDFIAYATRKEYVSLGFENDINIGTMQMQTGHKTLQSIERYRVGTRLSKKTRAVFDTHSDERHAENLEKALAGMPEGMLALFQERKKK